MISDGESKDGEQGEAFIEECDVFINASGAYNNWRWPTIPNRDSFKGTMIHSAIWPEADHMTGKTVSLIGNGSSGIQILPSILDHAEKIYVLLRSKTWVTPALANRFAGENGKNKIYTDQEKEDWSSNPEAYHAYRKEIESELNARFRLYLKDSQAQQMGREGTKKQMTSRLSAKPELVEDLIPSFPVGYVFERSVETLTWLICIDADDQRQAAAIWKLCALIKLRLFGERLTLSTRRASKRRLEGRSILTLSFVQPASTWVSCLGFQSSACMVMI